MCLYVACLQAQQAGRCGRSLGSPESLSIIVCFDSPVDQYYAAHPQTLFPPPSPPPPSPTPLHEQKQGQCNPYILRSHLLCAAHEIPLNHFHHHHDCTSSSCFSSSSSLSSSSLSFSFSEEELWGEGYHEALQYLLASPPASGPASVPASALTGAMNTIILLQDSIV